MNHTKEPWHTTYEDVGEWTVREDSNNELLADIYSDEKGYMENQKANAKRIVACVNACAGITNEALEAGIVKEAMELFWIVSDKAVLNKNNQMTYNGKTIFISDMEDV